MQTKHAQNEKHFNRTKRNNIKRRIRAIYYWYNNTRSSPADVKQNKRSRVYHLKIQTFSNFLPFGNDANFGNHPDAADVKIQPKYQDYLIKTQYFCNFSLVSLSIHPHSRRGTERIRARGVGAAPRRLLRVSFVQALQTSSKTNKRSRPADSKTRAQALQTSSNTNAREYITAKFKTLAIIYRLEMMPVLEIIQTLQTSRYNRSIKITSLKHNIFATSRLSRSASIRVHVEVPNG